MMANDPFPTTIQFCKRRFYPNQKATGAEVKEILIQVFAN